MGERGLWSLSHLCFLSETSVRLEAVFTLTREKSITAALHNQWKDSGQRLKWMISFMQILICIDDALSPLFYFINKCLLGRPLVHNERLCYSKNYKGCQPLDAIIWRSSISVCRSAFMVKQRCRLDTPDSYIPSFALTLTMALIFSLQIKITWALPQCQDRM